ncbi:MAG: hypothetical protein OHK005_13370 [Candidatus Methylacidiphilales bacterium]
MNPSYWQWSRLVPARLFDAWEERVGAVSGTTFSATFLPGKRAVRIHLYAPSQRVLQQVRVRFGGSLQRRSLHVDLRKSTAPFTLTVSRRLLITSTPPKIERSASVPIPQLHIPAGMAFGTGQHATTALCLRRLAELIRPNSFGTLLDVGTGTGVLALAAATWGWRALAFDNDPDAIREARHNAQRNGLSRAIRFQLASLETFEPPTPADLITANLFAALHEKFLRQMTLWCKPNGHLILSGILVNQEESVRRATSGAGLCVERRWRCGKWICLRTSRA